MVSARGIADLVRTLVREEVRRIRGQVLGAVARAVVTQINTAGGSTRATIDLHADEQREDVEVLEPYGFTSTPPSGAEGVALMVGGDAAHHIVLAVGDRSLRLRGLESGEVALYAGDGQVVLLKANGDVVITPAAGRNVLLGDDGATKRVALADEVDARFDAIKALYNTHVHAGVTVGPGSTGTTPSVIGTLAPTNSTNVYAKG